MKRDHPTRRDGNDFAGFGVAAGALGFVAHLKIAEPRELDVIALLQSGKLKDHILLARGGTTTFLAPALSMGAILLARAAGAATGRPPVGGC